MDIWTPDIPVWEIILRSLTVFLFLTVLIRMTGKRDVGEMSPSDFILLLLLSANVHTSLSGDDKSIAGGLIGAFALIGANQIMNKIAFKNRRFEKFLKGEAEVVILKGRPQEKIMKRHALTEAQLEIAIRKEGLTEFKEVRYGILETDGTISIIKENSAS